MEPETTVQAGVSTFMSMKPLDIINETLGIYSACMWRQNQEFKPKYDE